MNVWLESKVSFISSLFERASYDGVACTLLLMLAVFIFAFVVSHVNDNYSWVDRMWSIVPVVYAWILSYYSFAKDSSAPLLNTAFLFSTILTAWGIRLTLNFWRRGGYFRGGEDYRWLYVRTWPLLSTSPFLWTVFNFFIISLFQSWLLWAIALPVAFLPVTTPTTRDTLFAAVAVILIVVETLFDNQQWRFQCAKRAPGKKPKELSYGFCVTGLFGYSRHLNVFCEGCLWIVVALCAACQPTTPLPCWGWAGCGALGLLILFSTGVVTERLTMKKYPKYSIYQRTTPMLIPSLTSSTSRTLHLLDKETTKRRN